MLDVNEKVTRLEQAIEEFVKAVGIEFNKLYNSQMRTEAELREFKEEMRVFKEEMRAFKEEMRVFKEEMSNYRKQQDEEWKRWREEMDNYKKQQDEEWKKWRKEWSNLAKKMGTILEDLIAPALRPTLSKYFDCDVTLEGQRLFRKKDGESYEIDAIAGCNDKIFMIEVSSSPNEREVDKIKEKGERFFEFFPEFSGKQLIVIFGSITFPENVINYASRSGIYVMGWREWEYMDILNFEEVKK